MDVLKERTENFTNRGIVFNGMTPAELKASRDVLINTRGLEHPMHEGTDFRISAWFGIA